MRASSMGGSGYKAYILYTRIIPLFKINVKKEMIDMLFEILLNKHIYKKK